MRILIALFAASLAFAQTTKVFQLTQNQSPQEMQEMATLLRSVAEIGELSPDGRCFSSAKRMICRQRDPARSPGGLAVKSGVWRPSGRHAQHAWSPHEPQPFVK